MIRQDGLTHTNPYANSSENPYLNKRIVLGVGGGIAAYKAAFTTRLLVKAGASVQVVMSPAASEFVGAVTFQALSGNPVFSDLFNLEEESEIGHIAAADGADLVIVCPATANLMARIAAGRASDALSAVVLATRAPVLMAPSMNVNMWEHPATQRNLKTLQRNPRIHTVGPGVGFLACRWEGAGRLAEPADIIEAGTHLLTEQRLHGRRVVVTAGPTREHLDPVRFISNRSSGKMGYAIARAAARAGAQVELVSGPVSLQTPHGVTTISVETAEQMDAATRRAATGADVVIMVAAVCDYRPKTKSEGKLKKAVLGESPSIDLANNPDILLGLGQRREARGKTAGRRRAPMLVGFAAETSNIESAARGKLVRKKLDLIVANDVSSSEIGFGSDNNRVLLIDADSTVTLDIAGKDAIAHQICQRVASFLGPDSSDSSDSSVSSSDGKGTVAE